MNSTLFRISSLCIKYFKGINIGGFANGWLLLVTVLSIELQAAVKTEKDAEL